GRLSGPVGLHEEDAVDREGAGELVAEVGGEGVHGRPADADRGKFAELVAVEVPEVRADHDAVGGPAVLVHAVVIGPATGLSEGGQKPLPEAVGDWAVV